MSARNYPPERIDRYVNALNEADTYAQLPRRDDRVRFALAVMAVADSETDPVYKSGYDTGRMHAGGARSLLLRAAADEIEQTFIHGVAPAASERDEVWDQAVRAVATLLRQSAAEGKSSRTAADATPDKVGSHEARLAQLLDTIRTHGGKWSTGTLQELRRKQGGTKQRGTARRDLAELHRRGHLHQHGAGDGRFYTLKRRGGDA